MKPVFADSFYWIALVDRKDAYHERAKEAEELLAETPVVTTEEVLIEFLNCFASTRPEVRRELARWIDEMRDGPRVEIVEQSRASFDTGLALYRQPQYARLGLADCISIATIRARGIETALTRDRAFQNAGVRIFFDDGGP